VLLTNEGDAAFLVWGDPAFYDSTIRIVQNIHERKIVEFDYDVLPGISSLQVLAARHRIVLHEVGKPVLITTGRRLKEDTEGNDNLLVMLDGSLHCKGIDGEWQIWWGANLGAPSEVIASGALSDVLPEIEAKRAQAKAEAGWVMDTYLLRRS
jgi:precorrin-6A synthase